MLLLHIKLISFINNNNKLLSIFIINKNNNNNNNCNKWRTMVITMSVNHLPLHLPNLLLLQTYWMDWIWMPP